ncbi:MAG TPA: hypothetical protein VFC24_15540 [Casimicrobiaceae bacterium]|nr:hypothetical protein [Casimicrobiaceae bacterium]
MKRISLRRMLTCVASTAVLASPALAATTYVAVPLMPLQATSGAVAGINATGQIAGTLRYGPAVFHAFIASGDITTDLGDLGGTPVLVTGINDSGQLVGNVATTPQHAWMYSKGTMTELAIFGASSTSSGAAINNGGDIVGTVQGRAYVLSKGEASDLGTLGGSTGVLDSAANGINAAGQVTGWARTVAGAMHAFLYDGHMSDLGTLGGPASAGNAINSAQQVAGYADVAAGVHHAFVYSGGRMRDLGTLGGAQSVALGINANADLVGASDVANSALPHAFISIGGGAMQDLNGIVGGLNGAVLTAAVGINDNGQIAAQSCSSANVCQIYRLDPVSPKVTAIEYYHAGFNHYFITANPDEIRKLDDGTIPGWVRTGASFDVYAGPNVDAATVCRFFSTAFDPKSSHVYTASPSECEKVKQNPDWQFEGVVFSVPVPDASGFCPGYSKPVYRLYNNGQGGAPNHRYTTSIAIREQMLAQGWIGEGSGELGVAMCTP